MSLLTYIKEGFNFVFVLYFSRDTSLEKTHLWTGVMLSRKGRNNRRSTIVTLRWPGQSFLHPTKRARGGPAPREASGTFSASFCFITFLLLSAESPFFFFPLTLSQNRNRDALTSAWTPQMISFEPMIAKHNWSVKLWTIQVLKTR